jgi:MoaA/NifB/PqqE/SkfB family radical SAM enzyme
MLRRRSVEKPLLPPVMVSFAITRQCNLRCRHCYASATDSPHPNELTTTEAKRVISEVAASGARLLIFDGGEPLVRPDIYELVAHAKSAGLYPILGSNGTLLSTDAADKLKRAGIGAVAISIYGTDAKSHDAFTGREGSWARSLSGIRNVASAGIAFQLNTCLYHNSLAQFDGLADLARRSGAAALEVFDFIPVGRAKEHADLALAPEERVDFIRRVIALQLQDDKIMYRCIAFPQLLLEVEKTVAAAEDRKKFTRTCCGAGIRYCSIFYEGTVYPCTVLQKKAGNVTESSFQEIWQGSDVFKTLRNREKLGGKCGRCTNRDACAGARCLVFAKTGSLTKEDNYCWLGAEEIQAIPPIEGISCKHCGRKQLVTCEVCGTPLCEEHSFYCPLCRAPVCHPDVKECFFQHKCRATS